jgi:hypothetical protein
LAELSRGFPVAEDAEGSEVVQVALASALGYREDVVGVPQAAAGGDGLHAVEVKAGDACCASGPLQGCEGGDGVDLADGTDAPIAGKYLVAEVAGIGAETPLVNAVVGAEGASALVEDFEVAPAAERKIVRADGEGGAVETAAGHGAGKEHLSFEDKTMGVCLEVVMGVRGLCPTVTETSPA